MITSEVLKLFFIHANLVGPENIFEVLVYSYGFQPSFQSYEVFGLKDYFTYANYPSKFSTSL